MQSKFNFHHVLFSLSPFQLQQTTEESLRAFFEVIGEVSNASIVKEPVSQSSRYVQFISTERKHCIFEQLTVSIILFSIKCSNCLFLREVSRKSLFVYFTSFRNTSTDQFVCHTLIVFSAVVSIYSAILSITIYLAIQPSKRYILFDLLLFLVVSDLFPLRTTSTPSALWQSSMGKNLTHEIFVQRKQGELVAMIKLRADVSEYLLEYTVYSTYMQLFQQYRQLRNDCLSEILFKFILIVLIPVLNIRSRTSSSQF